MKASARTLLLRALIADREPQLTVGGHPHGTVEALRFVQREHERAHRSFNGPPGVEKRMSDQEGATQPAREERPQQATSREPERAAGGGGGGSSAQRDRDRGRRRHQQNQPRRPDQQQQQLPMDELRDLFALFTEHNLTEFEIEREGFRVHLGRNLAPQITAAPTASPSQTTTGQVFTSALSAHTGEQNAAATAPASVASTGAQVETSATEEESLHIIVSPIVGTFYRAPSPTAEPFVRLGSHVDPDAVVCIIEAMKLMNEIQAETSGEIAKIYVENGQPVEYGQPLFGVKK
jgi:acetyl-CoA carboxylase biotin carboxyl carrier protein